MGKVVKSGLWVPGGGTSFDTEGAEHGAEVSIILVDTPPGRGPRLHRHPYGETWVVAAGRARFTSGGDELEATTGDIVYVDAGTPHKFVNIGEDTLRMTCIHQGPRFSTVWLEPKAAEPGA